jgi:hypothetical protein
MGCGLPDVGDERLARFSAARFARWARPKEFSNRFAARHQDVN